MYWRMERVELKFADILFNALFRSGHLQPVTFEVSQFDLSLYVALVSSHGEYRSTLYMKYDTKLLNYTC
jgi:hypothetical protein